METKYQYKTNYPVLDLIDTSDSWQTNIDNIFHNMDWQPLQDVYDTLINAYLHADTEHQYEEDTGLDRIALTEKGEQFIKREKKSALQYLINCIETQLLRDIMISFVFEQSTNQSSKILAYAIDKASIFVDSIEGEIEYHKTKYDEVSLDEDMKSCFTTFHCFW